MRMDFKYNMRKIKWFFQKCKKGYSDRDLWNLDNWILHTLEKVINDFKIQNNHSYPATFDSMEDWTAELEYIYSLLKQLNEANEKGWSWWKDDTFSSYEEYYNYLNDTKDKIFDWFKKYLFNLWD